MAPALLVKYGKRNHAKPVPPRAGRLEQNAVISDRPSLPTRAGTGDPSEKTSMRMILMSALFALGVGLAGSAPAAAAPIGNLGEMPAASALLQDAQVVIVGPRHRRACRSVRVCHRGYGGRLRCHYERVCRR
jgi:hypothetical protein